MTVLELEGEGDDWRLRLNGDWSLAALAHVEAGLGSIPGGLHGTLVCDWSAAEHAGIGPAWLLLLRLAGLGSPQLQISHAGNPPHYLQLLQKLAAEQRAPALEPRGEPGLRRSVGKIGRWAVLQASEARGVLGFFGRLVTVVHEMFSRPRALRPVVAGAACL